MRRLDILTSLRFGGEGLKGAIRRTFTDGFKISMSYISNHSKYFFFPHSIFILHHNIFSFIARCLLNRKLANTPNGILVNRTNAINSSTYDNIVFPGALTKMKNSGVSELTA
jgi:hypothetical protein